MQFVATCLFGLERQLGEELDRLGLHRLSTMDGRVTFEGDATAVAAANVWLRLAERVFVRVGAGTADTFERLFETTKALPWEEWIGKTDAFPVKGHSIKSRLTSLPDCQSIVKKAIVERLKSKYGISWFEETGTLYQVEFFLFKDEVTLMIDTSGTALHKRGYRPDAGAAPLRETLAAALAYEARVREDVLLWDPFCGSGTIAIESAMLVANRAPGLTRAFAGETFAQFPSELWQRVREEARDAERTDCSYRVNASDIDPAVLELCRVNARRAGVASYLRIFEADARQIRREDCRGTVICNPPYGQRLMDVESARQLYREIAPAFRALAPWQIYLLTSDETFEKQYRAFADKVRKLYNGMIPCYLYEYFKKPLPANAAPTPSQNRGK